MTKSRVWLNKGYIIKTLIGSLKKTCRHSEYQKNTIMTFLIEPNRFFMMSFLTNKTVNRP